MPDLRNWQHQIKGGLGPLMRIMGAMNECLIVLIKDNRIGTVFPGGGTIASHGRGKFLQITHGPQTLRLVIHTTRRGVNTSERAQFDEASVPWIFDEARTDEELVAVQNAIRASLGIPPWDPRREPWSINR